jgi:Trypsin
MRYMPKRSTLSLLLALAFVVVLVAVGPPRIANAIINGQPDLNNAYPYVGFVTDGNFVCSGAAISPTLMITAAHCFDTPGTPVIVTFDQQGAFADISTFVLGTWHPDPNFCDICGRGTPRFDSNDVAVIVFAQPVQLSRYAHLPTEGLADAQPMMSTVKIVGYGIQDRLRRLDPDELFTRFKATSNLVQSNQSFGAQFLKLTANPSQGKGGICFGDSGGPDLLGNTDTILSINSFVTNVNCAGVTYHYRIDTAEALAFIESFE